MSDFGTGVTDLVVVPWGTPTDVRTIKLEVRDGVQIGKLDGVELARLESNLNLTQHQVGLFYINSTGVTGKIFADNFVASIVAPSDPGLEFTGPPNRANYTAPENRAHYSGAAEPDPLHRARGGLTMSVAIETQFKKAAEERLVSVSLAGKLDSGELLTGTPTIVEVTTSDLTLANKAVSTAQLTISGRTVAIGQAVQFKVSGGTAGTTYTIRITVTTDSTPAQTLVLDVVLKVN